MTRTLALLCCAISTLLAATPAEIEKKIDALLRA